MRDPGKIILDLVVCVALGGLDCWVFFGQVHNLAASDPHATTHGGGLFLVELA